VLSGKKLRILLAEGESGRAAAALRILYPEELGQLELTVVSGLMTLMASLEERKPDLIFLDLSVAHPDPLEAVRLVHRAAPEVALIVLVDEADQTLSAECLSHGAMDCLCKGHVIAETFERVVRVALEHNTLEGLANLLRDPVTGLYTRDGFLTLGSRAMGSANRKRSTLLLLCMRIENLAAIRARFGLRAEEKSLREVGALLASSFRRSDLVARLGESQFAVLAIDAMEPSGPVLRQRLESRIAVLNRESGPYGPLQVRMNARFWSACEGSSFAELLDSVEVGLRREPGAAEPESAVRETVSKE
jgi:diguanylate cyclase (GGDEF)-like protein